MIVVQNAQIGAKSIERCRVRWTQPSQNSHPGAHYSPQNMFPAQYFSAKIHISPLLFLLKRVKFCLMRLCYFNTLVGGGCKEEDEERGVGHCFRLSAGSVCVSAVLGLPAAGSMWRSECARRAAPGSLPCATTPVRILRGKGEMGPHTALLFSQM